MTDESTKNSSPGIIPHDGLISAEELCERLGLAHLGHLKTELKNLGLDHATICQKRLYRCRDIYNLVPKTGAES